MLLHLLVVGLLFWLSMDASEQKHTRDKEIWISVGVDPDFGDKSQHQGDLVAAASTSARPSSAASKSAQPAPPQQPAPKAPEATPTPRPTLLPYELHQRKRSPRPCRSLLDPLSVMWITRSLDSSIVRSQRALSLVRVRATQVAVSLTRGGLVPLLAGRSMVARSWAMVDDQSCRHEYPTYVVRSSSRLR